MENEGHDIVRAFAEQWNAVYVDGWLVYDRDDLFMPKMMDIVLNKANGNVASYEEKEVSHNWFSSREMVGGGYFPENIENVQFVGEEPPIIEFQGADSMNAFSDVEEEIKNHGEVKIRYSCAEPTLKVLKGYLRGCSGVDLSCVSFEESS